MYWIRNKYDRGINVDTNQIHFGFCLDIFISKIILIDGYLWDINQVQSRYIYNIHKSAKLNVSGIYLYGYKVPMFWV